MTDNDPIEPPLLLMEGVVTSHKLTIPFDADLGKLVEAWFTSRPQTEDVPPPAPEAPVPDEPLKDKAWQAAVLQAAELDKDIPT